MRGRGGRISITSSGQGFSLGCLTVDCVMNRGGSRSRTEVSAEDGEVEDGAERAGARAGKEAGAGEGAVAEAWVGAESKPVVQAGRASEPSPHLPLKSTLKW